MRGLRVKKTSASFETELDESRQEEVLAAATPETFPELIKRYRPGYHGWYVDSAEGALTGYATRSQPRRIMDLVREMSKLKPA
jgi:hypothetical protein